MKIALLAASATLLYSAHPAHRLATRFFTSADTSASFAWSGSVPSGGWLRIRNLAGSVEVRRSSGNAVEVRATREPQQKWSWGNTSTRPVKFVVQRQGSDIAVCALSDAVTTCDPNDLSSSNSWDDNWRPEPMRVIVLLPANVPLQAGTMHGDLRIDGASSEVVARTGHGDINVHQVTGVITASTGHGDVDIADARSRVSAKTGHGNVHVASASGPVNANTGHGDIVAELGSTAAAGSNDMTFETGHGNISVTAPKSLNGVVDLRTGRGHVNTSFPLTMDESSRHSRNDSAHGTLGSGGRTVRLFSGHGDVSLSSEDE